MVPNRATHHICYGELIALSKSETISNHYGSSIYADASLNGKYLNPLNVNPTKWSNTLK